MNQTACCARPRPKRYAPFMKAEGRGGHPRIQQEAADYMRQHGLVEPVTGPHAVDENLLRRAAAAYEALPHTPNDPKVKAAYDALKRETLAQYNHLERLGYRFEPHELAAGTPSTFEGADPSTPFIAEQGAPYQNERAITDDLVRNKHLYVFNGGDIAPDHPLAEQIPGHPLGNYNNVFRAVHDVFGHGKTGADFGHRGEDHAWRSHASMYSPLARRALATETRGQNSAFHFGQHGEHNRKNPAAAVYPDQKAALMPEEFAHPRANLAPVADPVKKSEGAPVSQAPIRVHLALHGLYKHLKPLVDQWEGQIEALGKTESGQLVKKAPPEFSEKTMHKLKGKYGTESAFKIAWAAHNKHGGDVKKAIAEHAMEKSTNPVVVARMAANKAKAKAAAQAPKPEAPVAEPVKKTAVTDGGMGDMAAPPAPNLGEMAMSEHSDDPMCKCEGCGRIDAYAKGEAPMTKATNPVVIARMAANKAKAKAAQAAAPAPQAPAPQPTAKAEDGDHGPSCTCPKCEAMDKYAKGEVPMAKTTMPAGATPTSPDQPKDGPKLPKAKVAAPKSQEGAGGDTEKLGKVSNPIVAARLAANKAKAKAAAQAPKPEEKPTAAPVAKAALNTSSPAPAGAAAATGANPGAATKPKNPIASMKTAVAGMKQAVAKLPGTTAAPTAPKPPKTPALGAGTPAAKAEMRKTAISPRDIAAQAAKRQAVAQSAGNLMDTMLATHPAGAQGGAVTGVMPGPGAAHKITLPGAHLFGGKK